MNNGLINYNTKLAIQNAGDDYDADNFYPANGSEFENAVGDEFMSEARGSMRKRMNKRQAQRAKIRDQRQARRDLRVTSKAKERDKNAATQAKIADQMGKDKQSDILMAKALGKSEKSEKGLSTGAKVGIGLGVAALLGLGIFFVIRAKKKK